MSKINVSIVLYNTNIAELNRCIRSIDLSNYVNLLTLIDNSETILDTASLCKPNSLKIKYLFNESNLGYGKAHNIAIKDSIKSENVSYHLVINADVFFSNNVIDKCYEFLELNSNIGNVVPNILYPDGTPQYPGRLIPSPIDFIIRFFAPNFFKKIHEERFALKSFYNKGLNFNAPFCSGSFMFLRLSVIKEIGSFDDRYFLYHEDTDLSRRIAQSTNQVVLSSETIFHHHGKAYAKSFKIFRIMFINMVKYFNKWGWINDKIRFNLNKKTLNQLKNKI